MYSSSYFYVCAFSNMIHKATCLNLDCFERHTAQAQVLSTPFCVICVVTACCCNHMLLVLYHFITWLAALSVCTTCKHQSVTGLTVIHHSKQKLSPDALEKASQRKQQRQRQRQRHHSARDLSPINTVHQYLSTTRPIEVQE